MRLGGNSGRARLVPVPDVAPQLRSFCGGANLGKSGGAQVLAPDDFE